MKISTDKELLRSILQIRELNKRTIALETGVSYQKLQKFVKGGNSWDALDNQIPVSVFLEMFLADVAQFTNVKGSINEQIAHASEIEDVLFFTSLLQRVTDKNKASRITAKVKRRYELLGSEYLILVDALKDFLQEVKSLINDHTTFA